jgi:hypothetical protein
MDPPKINYLNSNTLMVINTAGKMRQLFTPFKVQVLQDTFTLKKNSWVIVEEISPHDTLKLIYRIGTHWWKYDVFRINVKF